jgi:hypothetical protein
VDNNIGISLIIDLRGPHEREFEPDRVSSVRPPRMLALDVSEGVFAKLPGGMQVRMREEQSRAESRESR